MAGLSVLRKPEAFLLRAGGETVIRERRGHDMECWGLFTAVGKEGEDFGDFNKATGPWTVSAGGVAGLMSITYSHGRTVEELLPLHRSSGTRNVYPKIRSRRLVWQS